MDKQIDITIDPSMFAVNLNGSAKENFDKYTENLSNLEEILQVDCITICRNTNAVDMLMSSHKNISKLCNDPELDHIDCRDIISFAQRLVDRSNDFEDHHGISNVKLSSVNVTPKKICSQCLAATAILRSYCEEGNQDHYIMVSSTLNAKSISEAKIVAHIVDITSNRYDIAKLPEKPNSLEESVPIFSDFGEFIQCLNAEDILARAESECKIRLAMHVKLLSELRNLNKMHASDWNSIRPPYVGTNFLRYWNRISGRDNFCKYFLNAIADIYCRENSVCKILDTECGKGIPLVSRGKVVPMRFIFDDLIYIHFWLNCNGSIELASVHAREVSVIPDPSKLILRGR